MPTDREKVIALKKATEKMLEDTANEARKIRATAPPDKEVISEEKIAELKGQIEQKFDNNNLYIPNNNRAQEPVIQEIQPVETNTQRRQYNSQNPYGQQYIDNETPSPQEAQTSSGSVIKRDIPEQDKRVMEEYARQVDQRPNRNLDPVPQVIPSNRKFDIIDLVSKGECYSHKKKRIPVFYLTAREENLITSINLYKNGLLVDSILRSTIADPDINPDDLIQADIDAILLFLRSTAYGSDFQIIAVNPYTSEEFETTISLTQIKYNDFKLKGDEYGWFDYTTSDGDLIKFTFPNRKDDRDFERMVARIEKNVQTIKLEEMIQDLKSLQNAGFEEITMNEKLVIDNVTNSIDGLKRKLNAENSGQFYSEVLTSQMVMVIMSVNGNMDRIFVHEYVNNMRAGEALKFRKYVSSNAPSLNFVIEVTIPEGQEHAGETFKTQLSIDDTIFINVAD